MNYCGQLTISGDRASGKKSGVVGKKLSWDRFAWDRSSLRVTTKTRLGEKNISAGLIKKGLKLKGRNSLRLMDCF